MRTVRDFIQSPYSINISYCHYLTTVLVKDTSPRVAQKVKNVPAMLETQV